MSIQAPLPDLLRPESLDEFLGQQHLTGHGSILRNAIDTGNIPSMIFWGPPGVGKTSLANIISRKTNRPFYTLSAISSGVKDVREVISKSTESGGNAILFIDEIHRFSKSQQDSLLGAVEKGIVTLVGATTENPSFEVISPLLSRCQVYILKPLSEEDLLLLLDKAKQKLEEETGATIKLEETEALLRISGGDARKLINAFDLVVKNARVQNGIITLTNDTVLNSIQQNLAMYDKQGEMHYDIISAFIKSMRGSDPNAAVYYLARMVEAGEDPKFIARRMLILASEDIGNANPNALLLATNCFQAVDVIGYPECDLILSQTAIYLATSPKSNASYLAIRAAQKKIREIGDQPVPLHLRNAPSKLMKNINYGKDYQYAHDFPGNFVEMEFLPDKLKGTKFYEPQDNPREKETRRHLSNLWKKKYNY
ncbi:MAG: replication-associated recombination protein A [Bacteroidota bacterium]